MWVAEAGDRLGPVRPLGKGPALLPRYLLPPGDKPRTSPAGRDVPRNILQGVSGLRLKRHSSTVPPTMFQALMRIATSELFGVTDTSATVCFQSVTDEEVPHPHDATVIVEAAVGGTGHATYCHGKDTEASNGICLVRIEDLLPDTTYDLRIQIDHHRAEPEEPFLPARFRTLATPPGALLATIATVSDMHYGEDVAGRGPTGQEKPQFRAADWEPPYWAVMNGAVVADVNAVGVDCVLIKGDLTGDGHPDEFALAAAGLADLRAPWYATLGNHDAMQSGVDGLSLLEQPRDPVRTIEVPGCTLVLLNTVDPGVDSGHLSETTLADLDDALGEATTPVLVFGHHHVSHPQYVQSIAFGIDRSDSMAFLDVLARHSCVAGYFAGHTHRSRRHTFAETGQVPHVEVCATKEYPGGWGHYMIYEGGYLQEVRRASAPEALVWADRTKDMYFGLYRAYAFGTLADRCFTFRW